MGFIDKISGVFSSTESEIKRACDSDTFDNMARVRIEEIHPNEEKDNARYPFIATKITVL